MDAQTIVQIVTSVCNAVITVVSIIFGVKSIKKKMK